MLSSVFFLLFKQKQQQKAGLTETGYTPTTVGSWEMRPSNKQRGTTFHVAPKLISFDLFPRTRENTDVKASKRNGRCT